ncbi:MULTISPECIES: DUF2269 family protein [Pseudomonas]|jgi:uncharacterized membrane protein|uniref:DUF2269 domain-containing protein n=2 Tax=Pseudomonas TaxID=286 RepID=A0A127HTC7_PSEAZ|nr:MULTISPECIES: DUF2269 family protein [Pseudomonas]AMN77778.1 hypothetical protein AYR47_05295 [Pseudomonas azotoformans]ETK24073.1 hypothetical protein H096_08007 [Pseudomonas sp. FH1]NWA40148.1 DUF2269 family protein [Pseudomonas reactans]NWC84804.1 DUF2269 family protein [Pseudomonas reactans]NWD31446.1 DUF2269 family protein [Pseudomonas reactans]
METLITLKVIHIAATVLLLLSGLGLAILAWRKRSAGPAVTVQRPWAFVWLLMGVCVVSMPFTGWWLVHLIGWPLGQTWILGSSLLYTVAALAWFWLVARLNRLRKGEGGSLNFTLVLAVVSLVGFVAIAGLMGAKPV